MVNETNSSFSRRKLLRMSGAGMAATAGSAAIGNATADSQRNAPGHQEKTKRYRVGKNDQDKPKFAEDRKVGFAKGGFDKPITEDSVNTLYSGIIGENLDRESVALPRPTKTHKNPENKYNSVNEVVGLLVAVEDQVPYISVDRRPVGIQSPNEEQKKRIEGKMHKIVDDKVRGQGKNPDNASEGGR